MQIEVWSDVVCPWCYIGKKRLDKALAMFEHRDAVQVVHRAYQLNPDAGEVRPSKEYLHEKYGVSAAEVDEHRQQVCDVASGEGLCYDLSNILTGNTRDAHRLLTWAAGLGTQQQLLVAMYAAYFEQSKAVFTHTDLLAIVAAVGMDVSAATDVLQSDAFDSEVTEQIAAAGALGVMGVPHYVFDGKYEISGADDVEVYLRMLQAAWAESH